MDSHCAVLGLIKGPSDFEKHGIRGFHANQNNGDAEVLKTVIQFSAPHIIVADGFSGYGVYKHLPGQLPPLINRS